MRWMRLKVLPLVAVILLLFAMMAVLFGLTAVDDGWARKDDRTHFGWKGGEIKGKHYDEDDLRSTGWQRGGRAVLAGSVVVLLLLTWSLFFACLRVFACGPLSISHVGWSVLCLTTLVWVICWSTWAADTQKDRERLHASPDWAFAFAIAGSVCTLAACVALMMAPSYDYAVFEEDGYAVIGV
ncbi:hypothetical protein QOT17_018988 [Balamuthia mandrillaris]